MKAKNHNGSIKIYKSIPKSFGSIIAGFDLLSDSELENHGFFDVVVPQYDPKIQELGEIEWDENNNQFSYPVKNKTWTQTLSELKQSKISSLKNHFNQELQKTDWIIIRDKELGNTTDQDVLDQRAALRSDCLTHETAINSKSTKAQVVLYELPIFSL